MALKSMILGVVQRVLDEKIPHAKRPTAMVAQVTLGKSIGAEQWAYSLKLLDANMAVDSMTPEIPNIQSKVKVEVGKKVAVALLYGQLQPFIIGEVVDDG